MNKVNDNIFYEYNADGLCVKLLDKGTPVEYSYNLFGRPSKIICNGNEINLYYDACGQLIKREDKTGVIWQGRYSGSGKLIEEKERGNVKKTYSYNSWGMPVETKYNDILMEHCVYSSDFRKVEKYDAKNNCSVYKYDSFGNLIYVKNRLGKESFINYKPEMNVIEYQKFDGNKYTQSFSAENKTLSENYSDGIKRTVSFNSLNRITKISSGSGYINYSYNSLGNISESRKDNRSVIYNYNSSGKLEAIKTDSFSAKYVYDNAGKINSVRGNNFASKFGYDSFGREIFSENENGTKTFRDYDDCGRLNCIVQKNSAGEIIYAEGSVYNNEDQKIMSVNEKGLFTLYEYDDFYRLYKVMYPMTDDFVAAMESEYSELGFDFTKLKNEKVLLPQKYKNFYKSFSAKIKLSNLPLTQKVWTETYLYDANGNRISVENPLGKITYKYDAENRLTEISSNDSINLFYDDNGNLIRKSSRLKENTWIYTGDDRVKKSVVNNFERDSYSETYYEYDGLGRLCTKTDSNGSRQNYMYNGLSFDVLHQWNDVLENYNLSGSASSFRYRNLENSCSVKNKISADSEGVFCNFDRYFLKVNNRPIAQINENYSREVNFELESPVIYFSCDSQGSVHKALNGFGKLVMSANYNTDGLHFTNLGTKETKLGFDIFYNGKEFNSSEGYYYYGFRNYDPLAARFTTSDPALDGLNWYAYCGSDPVNHIDVLGLENVAADIKGTMQSYDFFNNVTQSYTVILGNADDEFVALKGCYANFISGMVNTLTPNENVTLKEINECKNLFCTSGDKALINNNAVAGIFGLEFNCLEYSGENKSALYEKAINDCNSSDTDYCISTRMEVKLNSGKTTKHWVGIVGGTEEINGKSFVQIIPTSRNDIKAARPEWIERNGKTFAPVDTIIKMNVYSNSCSN